MHEAAVSTYSGENPEENFTAQTWPVHSLGGKIVIFISASF